MQRQEKYDLPLSEDFGRWLSLGLLCAWGIGLMKQIVAPRADWSPQLWEIRSIPDWSGIEGNERSAWLATRPRRMLDVARLLREIAKCSVLPKHPSVGFMGRNALSDQSRLKKFEPDINRHILKAYRFHVFGTKSQQTVIAAPTTQPVAETPAAPTETP